MNMHDSGILNSQLNIFIWFLQVYTWGKGYCGALGHGDEIDKTTPEILSSLKSHLAVQVCFISHTVPLQSQF